MKKLYVFLGLVIFISLCTCLVILASLSYGEEITCSTCKDGCIKEYRGCNVMTCSYTCDTDETGQEHWYAGICISTAVHCPQEVQNPFIDYPNPMNQLNNHSFDAEGFKKDLEVIMKEAAERTDKQLEKEIKDLYLTEEELKALMPKLPIYR